MWSCKALVKRTHIQFTQPSFAMCILLEHADNYQYSINEKFLCSSIHQKKRAESTGANITPLNLIYDNMHIKCKGNDVVILVIENVPSYVCVERCSALLHALTLVSLVFVFFIDHLMLM